eukprot:comp21757_c0_seq1/m.30833 comp21757_c0_seq1/g.30833  ORF comp21757_c0_seq1/g.30833 comp21757_c0_seq1/m.30833 type:complete len:217 (-) comp21757_c0_seq1:380-1030(-)
MLHLRCTPLQLLLLAAAGFLLILYTATMTPPKEHGLIPDVFPEAFAAPLLSVTFGTHVLKAGEELTPEQVWDQPTISIPLAEPDSLYTIVMTDPDAPSRAEPKFREFLHWVVVNVPGGKLEQGGDTIAEYIGSLPPPSSGLHRYVLAAYKQPAKIDPASEPHSKANADTSKRRSWKLADFAHRHHLGHPSAWTYYEAQNSAFVKDGWDRLAQKIPK